jgi:hypothetical protein
LWNIRGIFWSFVLFIPFVAMCFVTGITNIFHFFPWFYRRIFGPKWGPIASSLMQMHGLSMRVQRVTVPGVPQFTVVTIADPQPVWLTVRRLSGLSPVQATALLAALDLKDDPNQLNVWDQCYLNLPALLAFVRRHQSIHILELRFGSIHPESLTVEPVPDSYRGNITSLSTPAEYIPYILPTEHAIVNLTIALASDGPQPSRS